MNKRIFTDLNNAPTRVPASLTGEYDPTTDPDAQAAVSRGLEMSLGNCPYCEKPITVGEPKEFDEKGSPYHPKCYGNPYPTTSAQNTQTVVRNIIPTPVEHKLRPVRPFVPARFNLTNFQRTGVTGKQW